MSIHYKTTTRMKESNTKISTKKRPLKITRTIRKSTTTAIKGVTKELKDCNKSMRLGHMKEAAKDELLAHEEAKVDQKFRKVN
jgi:hypothetical protein